MDHDNLNKFAGICIDGPIYFALWKCCRRGSLKVQKCWHKLFTWKFFLGRYRNTEQVHHRRLHHAFAYPGPCQCEKKN